MSIIGNKYNPNGQIWYGRNNFPGFLYKKNNSVGGRKTTKFTPGGNVMCNTYQYIYNKYKPGQSGVGAQTIANRRAKNRHATICRDGRCFPCYMTLGQYNNYTYNPNGFYPCLKPLEIPQRPINPRPTPFICSYYPSDSFFATFRGNSTNFYGQSTFDGPSTLNLKFSSSGTSIYNISGSSQVIDKNGFIYVCGFDDDKGLYCYYPDCSLKWKYQIPFVNQTNTYTSYSNPIIGCNNIIYFTSNGQFIDSVQYSSLYAFYDDGTLKFLVDNLQGYVDDTYPLIVNNSNILVSTSLGYVYIFNNKGEILSTLYLENNDLNGWCSVYDIESNSVYINSSQYLYKINMTNYSFISVYDTQINGLYSVPVVIDDYVYIASGSGKVLKYNKYDLSYITSNSTTYASMNDNSLLVDKNQNIYIGDSDGRFIKFNKNLNVIWIFEIIGENFNAGSAILSKNGLIYLNGYNSPKIYCLNTDGIQLNTVNYLFSNYVTPAIGRNELLYFSTTQGLLAYGN